MQKDDSDTPSKSFSFWDQRLQMKVIGVTRAFHIHNHFKSLSSYVQTTAELERERSEAAEIVRLVEASTEAELGQVRASLHSQLAEEHQNVIKLRSERAALRKNYIT